MSIAKIMLLVEKLSASEKLQLNEQLAASMVGQTSSVPPKSSRKGKPSAWMAFISHAKETMPERFAPPALPKDRAAIAKAIKEENPEAYKAFCEKFLAENPASDVEADAPAASAPVSPAPAPAPAAAAPASPAPVAAPVASAPVSPVADDAKAAAKAKAIAAKAARAKKVAA